MITFLQQFSPVTQALFATLFTYGVTAAGAGLVFMNREINQRLLDALLGFAAGVMIAASFWSLLSPGIEMAEQMGHIPWLTAAIGFMSGGVFMRLIDRILPHLHPGLAMSQSEGIKTSWQRSTLLVLAITLHNIPEGLAVGVAFGAVAADLPSASMGGAIALAIGIGLQNFPEGTAVSMPLRREGMSRMKSFLLGQASGLVEPVAGVLGALFVLRMQNILPYALCFAAGAMIFVSDVRLGTCMMDFRGFFPLYPYLGLGLSHPGFIADLVAQLADAANGDRFAMLFMAIDGQQDIGDQAGQHLDHEAMTAS